MKGEFNYYLADGRGPYATVQDALDAMGVDKEKRPRHNRWDRLSEQWKAVIQRREKGGKGGGSQDPAPGPSEGGEPSQGPGSEARATENR